MTVILVGMLELSRLRILRVHNFLLGTLSVQIRDSSVESVCQCLPYGDVSWSNWTRDGITSLYMTGLVMCNGVEPWQPISSE